MIDLGTQTHSPVLSNLAIPLYRNNKTYNCIHSKEISVSFYLLDDLVEILSDAYSISIS